MSRTHLEVGVNKTVDRKRRKFLRKKSVLKRVACSRSIQRCNLSRKDFPLLILYFLFYFYFFLLLFYYPFPLPSPPPLLSPSNISSSLTPHFPPPTMTPPSDSVSLTFRMIPCDTLAQLYTT